MKETNSTYLTIKQLLELIQAQSKQIEDLQRRILFLESKLYFPVYIPPVQPEQPNPYPLPYPYPVYPYTTPIPITKPIYPIFTIQSSKGVTN